MAKKKQTVRVVFEYKVTEGPDGEARTTAAKERKFVREEIVERLGVTLDGITGPRIVSVEVSD